VNIYKAHQRSIVVETKSEIPRVPPLERKPVGYLSKGFNSLVGRCLLTYLLVMLLEVKFTLQYTCFSQLSIISNLSNLLTHNYLLAVGPMSTTPAQNKQFLKNALPDCYTLFSDTSNFFFRNCYRKSYSVFPETSYVMPKT